MKNNSYQIFVLKGRIWNVYTWSHNSGIHISRVKGWNGKKWVKDMKKELRKCYWLKLGNGYMKLKDASLHLHVFP